MAVLAVVAVAECLEAVVVVPVEMEVADFHPADHCLEAGDYYPGVEADYLLVELCLVRDLYHNLELSLPICLFLVHEHAFPKLQAREKVSIEGEKNGIDKSIL